MSDCLIAFGSNEGNRSEIFKAAIKKLNQLEKIQVVANSQPVETVPVGGPEDQEDFLNAAIRIESSLTADELHAKLIEIENELGRERRTRWGSRRIDLDLLLYGDLQISTPTLKIPHPRMSFRPFVLESASEIAGDMIHPSSGLTISELRQRIESPEDVVLHCLDSEFKDFFDSVQTKITERFPGWDLRLIQDVTEFEAQSAKAKLVTHFEAPELGDEEAQAADSKVTFQNPLTGSAESFRGPRLELPRDSNRAETEFIAAIEAMQGSKKAEDQNPY